MISSISMKNLDCRLLKKISEPPFDHAQGDRDMSLFQQLVGMVDTEVRGRLGSRPGTHRGDTEDAKSGKEHGAESVAFS
jgi:hypothetical protein